ncbi:hypothetical protein V1514DRAFT_330513 [Lipomyces japonicus]|uniref:uncharacterized protein n=1 Tax=Lipomyces japonicus TaxID=56871 RepID=UPI0034CFBB90
MQKPAFRLGENVSNLKSLPKGISTLLSVPLIVSTTDGRQFCGTLVTTDNEQNIILSDVVEVLPLGHLSRRSSKQGGYRFVGLIVVPGQNIVRIEAERNALSFRVSQDSNKSPWDQII